MPYLFRWLASRGDGLSGRARTITMPVVPDPVPVIPYADTDTRHGVITEWLPDGGVQLTVSDSFFGGLKSILFLGGENLGQFTLLADLVRRYKDGDPPIRLILTLSTSGFGIHEPYREPKSPNFWRLDQIGVIRPNRYERGVYVTIAGHETFNLIPDCADDVIKYVSATLEQTLARLRNPPVAHVVK